MSNRSTPLTDTLHQYLLDVSLREPDVLRRLREATAELHEHNRPIAPIRRYQGQEIVESGLFGF